jgi:hypothetical protein
MYYSAGSSSSFAIGRMDGKNDVVTEVLALSGVSVRPKEKRVHYHMLK